MLSAMMDDFEPDESFSPLHSEARKMAMLMVYFAKRTAARVTIRQVLAFLTFAEEDVKGSPQTVENLRDLYIPDALDGHVFGTALTRSFAVWFAPSKDEPNALNWLYSVPSQKDKRNKFIRLTDEGKAAYREVLKIIG